jgi:hypothetical protein
MGSDSSIFGFTGQQTDSYSGLQYLCADNADIITRPGPTPLAVQIGATSFTYGEIAGLFGVNNALNLSILRQK